MFKNIDLENRAWRQMRKSLRAVLKSQHRWGPRLNLTDHANFVQMLDDYDWLLSECSDWETIKSQMKKQQEKVDQPKPGAAE